MRYEKLKCTIKDTMLYFDLTIDVPSGGKSFVGFYGSQPCYEDDAFEVEYTLEMTFQTFADMFDLTEEQYPLEGDLTDEEMYDCLENFTEEHSLESIFSILEEYATELYDEEYSSYDFYDYDLNC